MDNKLKNGDMLSDLNGDVQTVSGLSELIQVALLRLSMRKGSFPYNPSLGSTLYRLDSHNLEKQTVYAIVAEALADLTDLTLLDIEQSFDADSRILYLTIYLQVAGEDAILEWQKVMQ